MYSHHDYLVVGGKNTLISSHQDASSGVNNVIGSDCVPVNMFDRLLSLVLSESLDCLCSV